MYIYTYIYIHICIYTYLYTYIFLICIHIFLRTASRCFKLFLKKLFFLTNFASITREYSTELLTLSSQEWGFLSFDQWQHGLGPPGWHSDEEPTCQCRRHRIKPRVRSLGREDPLEKEMTAQSSILAWEIPWSEEPGRLRSLWGHQGRIRLSD